MNKEDKVQLLDKYEALIQPHAALAKRAFGSKDQITPAHTASREYTRLLVEFRKQGGSLINMAERLGVAYSGLRRRVFTADIPSIKSARKQRSTIDQSTIDDAINRVRSARASGTPSYHRQLHEEFNSGIPMNLLARGLGISNAAPLYYGVQRHYKTLMENEAIEKS